MELLNKISALEEEASQFGFKWQSADQIMDQIHSECNEIKEHIKHESSKLNQTALQEEIGDLLHAVFSLCIFYKLSPKVTLGQSLTKFERRLRAVKLIAEECELVNLEGLPFDEKMHIWDKAKELVG
jgi:uncharacterized protein YabN with tetrapyrrole methylase and pyrophosphatase domain